MQSIISYVPRHEAGAEVADQFERRLQCQNLIECTFVLADALEHPHHSSNDLGSRIVQLLD